MTLIILLNCSFLQTSLSQKVAEYESLCLRENQLLSKARLCSNNESYSSSSLDAKESLPRRLSSSASLCQTIGHEFVSSDDISLLVCNDNDFHLSEDSGTGGSYSDLKVTSGVGRLVLKDTLSFSGKESIFNLPQTIPRMKTSASFCQIDSKKDNNCFLYKTPEETSEAIEENPCDSNGFHVDRSYTYTQNFLSKCQENGCKIDSRHIQRIRSFGSHSSSLPSSSSFPEENSVTKL